MTSYGLVVGEYQYFGDTSCLQMPVTLKVKAAINFKRS
jgi:hypothetical protein